ncbi:methylmalonyl-CoA mutase family protein [Oceaniserpentilla sp. 4NH20-0058]|uniref:methylmalonyl-CoA mutase family protein n=1 Tax=Oceaniserpentilla sp. 4NH20-0058 TaxID=3127660 RepID=UPI003103CC84
MSLPPLRFVTAASLFDGHDAAINIMRRLIQNKGAEVIHLGHNRSVEEVVNAAIEEDANAICVSSYQGGHIEYFKYLVDQLKQNGAHHISVFGGGGGTITHDEIHTLENYGVEKIYHPNDGLRLGLTGIIDDVINRVLQKQITRQPTLPFATLPCSTELGRILSAIENDQLKELKQSLNKFYKSQQPCPVIGISGTGGSGKSSLTDELLLRFKLHYPQLNIAVLAVDPSKRRTGGALLGDRIRMNSLRNSRIFMRSMATRRHNASTNAPLQNVIQYLKHSGFDLVVIETAGTGQSDSEIVDHSDISCYVMTHEYGAASQLEKIDMLDMADCIIINKFEKLGSEDALRDVRKQWRRNHNEFTLNDESLPIYPCMANQFNDTGVTYFFNQLLIKLSQLSKNFRHQPKPTKFEQTKIKPLIPTNRTGYLSEITQQARNAQAEINAQAEHAKQAEYFYLTLKSLNDENLPSPLEPFNEHTLIRSKYPEIAEKYNHALSQLTQDTLNNLKQWQTQKQAVTADQYHYQVREKTIQGDNYKLSLSGLNIPKVCTPKLQNWHDLVIYLAKENLPGFYPYTAGVFPYRRDSEDPIRMFAGEGTPERSNHRFHYLSQGQNSIRLSTAFDSVTLYGDDPHTKPDIYGKIGNSGVSIATLDDMKKLFSGFDLCAPDTSVSMTINGPAPIILAFFLQAAIDQQVERHLKQSGDWEDAQKKIACQFKDHKQPKYQGPLPESHNQLGLALLGINGESLVDSATYKNIKRQTLNSIRGTVQADILKEDQAQNTCIFSTEFALKMMGDMQEYFINNNIQYFYSVSISGYHIAEAGANPITQLAFTLANGFTMVEYYLQRGMDINDFAPNLSFFFSNGMDPEYAVIGRVARRIWARAIKHIYQGNPRSQKLKYHIQTSGRSLHAQEIQFNDIRTTLQAMYALFDNCNSLHTNAYDEALTTPSEESVRRAVAIQLIINHELGMNMCENPMQGSYFIEQLTDLVENAVLEEFDRINQRGGVLGAMDTMYQRSKIQDESMNYEHKKHDGSLAIIGVNTFLGDSKDQSDLKLNLARSNETEKQQQINTLNAFHERHNQQTNEALTMLTKSAQQGTNIFEALMETVKHASLGQICKTLYSCGGEYRRNM